MTRTIITAHMSLYDSNGTLHADPNAAPLHGHRGPAGTVGRQQGHEGVYIVHGDGDGDRDREIETDR